MRVLGAIFFVAMATQAMANGTRVIDGDTLEIDGKSFRILGIDAPEAGQRCEASSGGNWQCGREAIATMQSIVSSGAICTGTELDEFGRTLASCSSDGNDVGLMMVEAGMAWAFRRYDDRYASAEDAVRPMGIGIWQAETQAPWDYRAQRWDVEAQEAPAGCPIKGNISSDGERIYHAPWSPWYSRTKLSEEKGERWFCDEGEALEAGWRAPFWGG